MFLFLKLVLAHLIADFILQFEELYQLKIRSSLGHFAHALVHGFVSLALLYPYLNEPSVLAFLAGLVLIHLAQDLVKYASTQKKPANTFLYFMIDQAVHILVIGAVFFLPVSREIRGFPTSALLDTMYRTEIWTTGPIFFITLTFAGSYILNAFSKSYLKDPDPMFMITSQEVLHALIERSVMASAILLTGVSPWLLLAVPGAGLLRLPFKTLRDWKAFFLSLSYAVMITLLFRKALL